MCEIGLSLTDVLVLPSNDFRLMKNVRTKTPLNVKKLHSLSTVVKSYIALIKTQKSFCDLVNFVNFVYYE